MRVAGQFIRLARPLKAEDAPGSAASITPSASRARSAARPRAKSRPVAPPAKTVMAPGPVPVRAWSSHTVCRPRSFRAFPAAPGAAPGPPVQPARIFAFVP
jgi:hypothetical protein